MYFLSLSFQFLLVIFLFNPSFQLKPNVLLLVVDDLRPALGVYGDKNAYTPNIDKLAQKSFVFTNAFAQQALCAPSRNSFLTSRRPDSLHLYDFYSYWRDTVGNFTTLPQHFKENGYFTHSIGKVFHPGISSNFTDDAKYSWSKTPYHPPTEKYKEAKVCPTESGGFARNLLCPILVEEQPGGSLPDLESLNAALDFLKYRDNITDLPYFLAVGFHKPHIPFKFPIEYLDYHPLSKVKLPENCYRPPLLPTVAWNPWTDVRQRDDIAALNISFPFGPMLDNFTQKIIQHYSAATTYLDDLIGQLLQKVDENTIIILIGDHGWSMGEHGEFSKFSNFDIATRVPFIIHVPRLSYSEIISNELVELVDLFPTLVDLTQISDTLEVCSEDESNLKLCTEGKSLVSLMISTLRKKVYNGKKAIFNQYPRPGRYPTKAPNSDKPRLNEINIMGYSIRTSRYRYTEWVPFNHTTFIPNWTKVVDKELYDHLIDPNENLNLISRSEMKYVSDLLHKELILGWRYV